MTDDRAQTAGRMPADLAAKIAALGRVVDVPGTHALYAALHDKEPYGGAAVTRDLAYGPDPLQKLDVFTPPPGGGAPRTVFVHVHGGGFERGDKHTPGTPFTDNIPLWAARHGMVGVNVNYRLAPAAKWPSGPKDIAAILRWIKANIGSFGGDAARVVLAGSSAGGNHVTSYLAFPQFHSPDDATVVGAVTLSGTPFDTTVFPTKMYACYFGDDASAYVTLSPTPGLLKSSVPLLIIYTANDPPAIEAEGRNLAAALRQAGKHPREVFSKTHNHISVNDSIGTADTEISGPILDFVTSLR